MQRLTDCQRKLVEDNIRLCGYAVKRVVAGWEHRTDELNRLAETALIQAAVRFDPEFGVKFSTYACTRIFRYLRRHQGYWQREAENTPINLHTEVAGTDAAFLADIVADQRIGDGQEQIDVADEWEVVVERCKLKPEEVQLLHDHFVRGFTFKVIGKMHGQSASRWQLKTQRLVNKCRKIMQVQPQGPYLLPTSS